MTTDTQIEMTLKEIEKLAEQHAEARHELLSLLHQINEETLSIKEKYHEQIRDTSANFALTVGALKMAIEDNTKLFESPRTYQVNGVKYGVQKKKGSAVVSDEAKAVKYIQTHYEDPESLLTTTTTTVNLTAVQKLPAAEIKKMGISIKGAGDAPIISYEKSDIEKMLKSVLAEQEVA